MSAFARIVAIAAVLLLPLGFASPASAAEEPVVIPAPAADLSQPGRLAVAVFAGGCFWGVQGVFQHVEGVTNAVSGYAGGTAEDAEYRKVSSGRTVHAEAVEVTYDPSVVSYGELLHVYFSVAHNPTQLNYQGPDHGPQYRSAVFYVDEEQKRVTEAYIAQLDGAGAWSVPIVTAMEPLVRFYPAEQYHQDYMTLNPTQPYIFYNDLPKVAALERLFPQLWRVTPKLVGTLAAAN